MRIYFTILTIISIIYVIVKFIREFFEEKAIMSGLDPKEAKNKYKIKEIWKRMREKKNEDITSMSDMRKPDDRDDRTETI